MWPWDDRIVIVLVTALMMIDAVWSWLLHDLLQSILLLFLLAFDASSELILRLWQQFLTTYYLHVLFILPDNIPQHTHTQTITHGSNEKHRWATPILPRPDNEGRPKVFLQPALLYQWTTKRKQKKQKKYSISLYSSPPWPLTVLLWRLTLLLLD